MSKFKIYRTDMKDPRALSRRNKWFIGIISGMYFFILLTTNLLRTSIDWETLKLIDYFLFALWILTLIIFFITNKRQYNSIRKIGILEFKRSTIIKTIGDLKKMYHVENIQRIELETHISDFKISQGKDSFLTYIIMIINPDQSYDQFIVAAKSDDFRQKIFITDTLKMLKKLSGIDVRISTTIMNSN